LVWFSIVRHQDSEMSMRILSSNPEAENMKRETQSCSICIVLLVCLLLSGCMRMGPGTIPEDQFDYATAIGDAKKQQILRNIIKLRYAEWPVFLEVGQVVAGYNWEYRGNATLNMFRMFDASKRDTGQLGVSGAFIERPTITYAPLGGERFVRSILTPAKPESMLALIDAGWPADRLFTMMVDSVNGKTNRRYLYGTDHPVDPAFVRFVDVLRSIHTANAFSVRVRQTTDERMISELYFRPQLLDAATRRELDKVKAELSLNPDINSYRIIWDSTSEDPNAIAIKTRSIIQVMTAMAVFVELPPEEMTKSGVIDLNVTARDGGSDLPPLINIHSGPVAPTNAFVVVPYHDQSFWIDAEDWQSRLSLAYLTLLLTVNETGEIKGPQLTISAN